MSNDFSQTHQQSFHRAEVALQKLLSIQRKVKACAEALRDAPNAKVYEQIARDYVALLDEWDAANAQYTAANADLLKITQE